MSERTKVTAPRGSFLLAGPGLESARGFLALVGTKLEVPAAEIVVHLGVTVLSVLSIALIEWLLHVLGLDDRKIPWTEFKLSDWMFDLEMLAATTIIIVGIIKATVAASRAP